jgi:hypothetical protein
LSSFDSESNAKSEKELILNLNEDVKLSSCNIEEANKEVEAIKIRSIKKKKKQKKKINEN